MYDDAWLLRHEFYKVNKHWFDRKPSRAISWYTWKPFIIMHAFDRLKSGDLLLYTDGDTFPISPIDPLYEQCDKDSIMLFNVAAHQKNNRAWTKRDQFVITNTDESKYWDMDAPVARFMLFKAGSWLCKQILCEWLTYTCNEMANTFSKSILKPELDGFIENRCEQSLLGLVAARYGVKLWRECDQSGEGYPQDRDVYGQVFCQVNTRSYLNQTAPVLGSRFANVP